MGEYTMDQYTLQSYFKSLCKSFYFAYKQVKRLEKIEEEMEEKQNKEYSEEERIENSLKNEREQLEFVKSDYDKNMDDLLDANMYWTEELQNNLKQIKTILSTIRNREFSIIITSEEEIIAFMAFFSENSTEKYRVINTEAEYLEDFPTGKKMYEEFLEAYSLEDDKKMEQVIDKYF